MMCPFCSVEVWQDILSHQAITLAYKPIDGRNLCERHEGEVSQRVSMHGLSREFAVKLLWNIYQQNFKEEKNESSDAEHE